MGSLGNRINNLTKKALWNDTLVPGVKITDPATLRVVTAAGAFDPDTGGAAAATTSDVAIRVLATAYSAFQVSQSNGKISAGDLQVVIYADASIAAIDEKASLIYKGKTWALKDMQPATLDEGVLLYTCRATS